MFKDTEKVKVEIEIRTLRVETYTFRHVLSLIFGLKTGPKFKVEEVIDRLESVQ